MFCKTGEGLGYWSLTMKTEGVTPVEKSFLSLPESEREVIISLGAALRLSYLRKRLFLAESKIQRFEKKHGMTLAEVEAKGLPDDADYRMHEDYVMWHHWGGVASQIKRDIDQLETITEKGLLLGDSTFGGC
jgi:hypothetical protein